MTHTQRIQRLLQGEALDRPCYAGWGHFMNFADRNAKDFAKATIDLQKMFDFDLIKMMPNPYYMIEDTGLKLRLPENFMQPVARTDVLPINNSKDWARVPLPQLNKGALAREKEAIARVVDHFAGTVPVLATIFTPIMWISYMAIPSKEMERETAEKGCFTPLLERLLLEQEREIAPVLSYFSELNQRYMEELLDIGVSGFFYCTEHARDTWSSKELFEHFEKQYDLAALQAVQKKSLFSILHVCGEGHLRMDWILDYPVAALNWDDQWAENPSLAQVRSQTSRILVGGLDRHTDLLGIHRQEIKERIKGKILQAMKQAGNQLIVSGGCDWSIDSSYRFGIWQEVMEEFAGEEAMLI